MAIKSIHVIRTNVQPTTLWMALAMAMSGLMTERALTGVRGGERLRESRHDGTQGALVKGYFASHEEVLAGTPDCVRVRAGQLAHSRKHQLVVIEESERDFAQVHVWYAGRPLFKGTFNAHRDYAGDIVYGGQVLNNLTFDCYNRWCDWVLNRRGRMTASDWEYAGREISNDYYRCYTAL